MESGNKQESKTAEELNLPWHYQEGADAYTHIIRDKDNNHILQGKQFSNGSEEAKIRFIVDAVNASQQCSSLKEENERLRKTIEHQNGCNFRHILRTQELEEALRRLYGIRIN